MTARRQPLSDRVDSPLDTRKGLKMRQSKGTGTPLDSTGGTGGWQLDGTPQ